MAAIDYEKIGCEVLGLRHPSEEVRGKYPDQIFHLLGYLRFLDSEAAAKAIIERRLKKVKWNANATAPSRTQVRVPEEEAERIELENELVLSRWHIEHLSDHLFLSYEEYLDACRPTPNPPQTPNVRDRETFNRAVDQFRTYHYSRSRHTPDWQGYLRYVGEMSLGFFKLLEHDIPTYFPEADRLLHSYVLGTTGSGKSELLKIIAYSYVSTPDYTGVVVIDPNNDFAEQIAKWVEHAAGDRLIYIYPMLKPGYTPTINPFDLATPDEHHKRLLVQELVNVFGAILKEGMGASLSLNMRTILRQCILVLLDVSGSTFRDLRRFMVDDTNEDLVETGRQHPNPDVASFFQSEFGNPLYKQTKLSLSTKIRDLLDTGTFADLTCGRTTINLEKAVNEKKFIIFNLPKGIIGEEVAQAFGKLVVALLQTYAQRRASIPERFRPRTHLLVDECHNFILPSIKDILRESRKFRLHLTLAQQNAGDEMSTDLARIVLGNTSCHMVGVSRASEVKTNSDIIGVEAADLRKLSVGQFYARIGSKPPFRFSTRTDLLGDEHAMPESVWELMVDRQISQYYRPLSDLRTGDQVAPKEVRRKGKTVATGPAVPPRKLV